MLTNGGSNKEAVRPIRVCNQRGVNTSEIFSGSSTSQSTNQSTNQPPELTSQPNRRPTSQQVDEPVNQPAA